MKGIIFVRHILEHVVREINEWSDCGQTSPSGHDKRAFSKIRTCFEEQSYSLIKLLSLTHETKAYLSC
jgi:hypothetical protein